MDNDQVTLPDQQTIRLPASTVAAIAQAKARYAEPLWQLREERVLKLGGHQWIEPGSVTAARTQLALHPDGIVALAWKLFNRDWRRGAAACFADAPRYPHHPRQWGEAVVPLVDDDGGAQQIGWARIEQSTAMDHNFAVFVQFTILALFDPIPLPAEYA